MRETGAFRPTTLTRNLMKKLLALAAALSSTGIAPGEVIFTADYLAPDYATTQLAFQPFGANPDFWVGQSIAQVDSSAGTVSSIGGPFDRNMWNRGAKKGIGSAPSTSGFENGDQIKITFNYSFEITGDVNTGLARVGIRNEGPNGGNGFDSSPLEGLAIEYNGFDDTTDPSLTDGNVKFWPDKNDVGGSGTNSLFLQGLEVGIDPANAVPDLVSDPLTVEYLLTFDGLGNFAVTSLEVTNQTTAMTFTYGGPAQSFPWTDGDAFYAQQLAFNGNAGMTGTSSGVTYEFIPAPAVIPFVCIDYTAAEGYVDGQLASQQGWLGQIATSVSTLGTGTAFAGTFTRNVFGNGLRGGTGGAPATTGDFISGTRIRVIFDYQFTLGNSTENANLGKVGFRTEGPNAGNGFESAPEQGFSMQYNQFMDTVNGGGVKFWPDFNDEDLGNVNALIINGHDAGVDPENVLAGGVDLDSDPLRIFYELSVVGDGTWNVNALTVANLTTGQFFCYDGPPQSFPWTAIDAFFAQQYMRKGPLGNGFIGTTDRVKIDFLKPATIAIDFTAEECYVAGPLAGDFSDTLNPFPAQNGWLGQSLMQVDPTGTGTVSTDGIGFNRTMLSFGVRGSKVGPNAVAPVGCWVSFTPSPTPPPSSAMRMYVSRPLSLSTTRPKPWPGLSRKILVLTIRNTP